MQAEREPEADIAGMFGVYGGAIPFFVSCSLVGVSEMFLLVRHHQLGSIAGVPMVSRFFFALFFFALLFGFFFSVPALLVGVATDAWWRARVRAGKTQASTNRVVGATAGAVTAFALFAVFDVLLLAHVAPQFEAMFAEQGSQLPQLTEWLMTAAGFAERWWILTTVLAAASTLVFGYFFCRLYRAPRPALANTVYGIAVAAHGALIGLGWIALQLPLV
jgi:hypothetical protein